MHTQRMQLYTDVNLHSVTVYSVILLQSLANSYCFGINIITKCYPANSNTHGPFDFADIFLKFYNSPPVQITYPLNND